MSIVRKIKHLLALARGSSGNESQNAMAAARALADKHHVSWQSVVQEEHRDEVAERVIGSFAGGLVQEWELLALNFVQRIRPSIACSVHDCAIKIVARHSLEAAEGAEIYLLVRWCVVNEAINCVTRYGSVFQSRILEDILSLPEFGYAAYGILGAWHDEWSDEIERHAWRVRTKDLVLFIEPPHVTKVREHAERQEPFTSPDSSPVSPAEPTSQTPVNPPDAAPQAQPPSPPPTPAQEQARKHQREQARSDAIRATILEASKRVQAEHFRQEWQARGYRFHRSSLIAKSMANITNSRSQPN